MKQLRVRTKNSDSSGLSSARVLEHDLTATHESAETSHGTEQDQTTPPAQTTIGHDFSRMAVDPAQRRPVNPTLPLFPDRGVIANQIMVGAEQATTGSPLPTGLQNHFQDALGHNLSRVRIHTDAVAADAAKSLKAKAFTVGQDIHFSAGAYQPDSRSGQHLLAHEVTHTVQQRQASSMIRGDDVFVSERSDPLESAAAKTADYLTGSMPGHDLDPSPANIGTPAWSGGVMIQRQDDGNTPGNDSGAAPTDSTTAKASPGNLIVEDNVEELEPGQMTKSAFLAQTKPAVAGAVSSVVAGTMWESEANAQVEQQFANYAAKDAKSLESAIRQQVPGASAATDASAYIPIITTHVQQTVQAQVPTVDSVAGQIADAGGGVVQSVGDALSSAVDVLFKGRDGGPRGDDTQGSVVSAQLGGRGQPLHPHVRFGLESAYQHSFSDVRVHTGTLAGKVADKFNARAFTVGKDVVFGPAEYRPGTLVGDALIAHELAHVVQQSERPTGNAVHRSEVASLEHEADAAAVDGVASLRGIKKGRLDRRSLSLRTGLSLQRCSKSSDVDQLTDDAKKVKSTVDRAKQIADLAASNAPEGPVKEKIKQGSGYLGQISGGLEKAVNAKEAVDLIVNVANKIQAANDATQNSPGSPEWARAMGDMFEIAGQMAEKLPPPLNAWGGFLQGLNGDFFVGMQQKLQPGSNSKKSFNEGYDEQCRSGECGSFKF